MPDAVPDESTGIRAVLDCSALLSYARGHIHVGELLVDIADEGAQVGVPAVALLDAHARLLGDAQGRARLGVLVSLPGATVLELGANEAVAAATNVPLANGDLSRAHAVWAALEYEAYYLTTEPRTALTVFPADQVHAIPADDA